MVSSLKEQYLNRRNLNIHKMLLCHRTEKIKNVIENNMIFINLARIEIRWCQFQDSACYF